MQRDPIIDYLSYFNQIDKHFDKILNLDKFLPYNEKIKRIIEGEYTVSRFVSLHKFELKFFGELRNHITHGIKLDGHNYAIPSHYALDKIKRTADAIKVPPTWFDIFKKTVYFCKTTDHLKDVLLAMQKNSHTHVPVYDKENKFAWVLTEGGICYRLANQLSNPNKKLKEFIIWDVNIQKKFDDYLFVSRKMNIYEIDEIFTLKRKQHKRLGAIFVTNHGKESEKILWIVTAWDVAIVDTYVVH